MRIFPLLLAVLLFTPAVTANGPGPTDVGGTGVGEGWALADVHFEDATFLRLELEMTGVTGLAAITLVLEGADGTRFSMIGTWGRGQTHVSSTLLGVEYHVEATERPGGMRMTSTMTCPSACLDGDHRLLVFAAGRLVDWSWALASDQAIVETAPAVQGDTVVADIADFKGPLTLVAGGKVALAGETRIPGEGDLVAIAFAHGLGLVMTATGPEGTQLCSCVVGGLREATRADPNDHTFHLNGAGAPIVSGGAYLVGVVLPR